MKRNAFGLIGAILIGTCGSAVTSVVAEQATSTDTSVQQIIRQYGPTSPTDTLWGVANKVRPEPGLSIYQVMVALHDANPHAFANSNLNSLEKGVILLVPSADTIASYPVAKAKARAEGDDSRWGKVAAKPSGQNSKPKPIAKPKAEPEVVAAKPQPKPAAPVQPKPSEPALSSVQTNELKDELSRNQEALQTAQESSRALTQEVATLKGRLGATESELQVTRYENDKLVAELEKTRSLNQQLLAENRELKTGQAGGFWSFLISNWWLLLIVAIIPAGIVLAVAYWMMSRKAQAQQTPEQEFSTGEAAPQTFAAAEVNDAPLAETAVLDANSSSEQAVDLEAPSHRELMESSEAQDSEMLDALWEQAMNEQSEVPDSVAQEINSSPELAGELEPQRESFAEAEPQTAELPEDDLIQALDQPELTDTNDELPELDDELLGFENEPVVRTSAEAEPSSVSDDALMAELDDQIAELNMATAEPAPVVEEPGLDAIDISTEFDGIDISEADEAVIELGDISATDEMSLDDLAQSIIEETQTEQVAEAKQDATADVDPDTASLAADDVLEWSLDDATADEGDLEAPSASDEAAEQVAEFQNDGLDFDISDINLDPPAEPEQPADDAIEGIDLSDDIRLEGIELASDEAPAQTGEDFIDIDVLMQQASDAPVENDPYQDPDVDFSDLDEVVKGQKDIDVDDAENSINAKLDLARAYIEIQDTDSARALLKEISLDGNDEQKVEAERLIGSL
ncbi:FimV/HubP family polar landmark protein [Paraferrimonas sedimenticola]|nr:FimV/HubP family polar landmark protein [Paraferrimonas sedimenticola]